MPFNYQEYQQKCNNLSTEELQKEWENYTRQIAGGATSTATSVLFSPLTAGVSLVGLGLSGPRIHNARKKREIIEKAMQAQGATHNTRTRDVAGSMAVSGVIAGLTLGLASPGADMIAGEAAGKGAEYVVAHVALDGAGAAVEHKHDGHLKKKGETQLKMTQMQHQLNQYQGYQQQVVQGQGMQMQGVQMQPGPFQPPPLTQGMQLSQPGILMQNQQQIQWHQQQIGLQVPGINQPQLGVPGLVPMQVPPRPHSAAPDNQYQRYQAPPAPQFIQQAATQQPLPQYQHTQQTEKFHLVTIPSQTQEHVQTYPPEKTPAYTYTASEQMQGNETPLPLYSQQVPATPGEAQRALPPSHIDIPEGPTMEEELLFLKARLLQMELEKRGMSATISSPCEISLNGPNPTEKKEAEIQSSVALPIEPSEEASRPTEQLDQGSHQPVAPEQHVQEGIVPLASPIPQAASVQEYAQSQTSETQTQQYSSSRVEPQQTLQQPPRQHSLVPAPVTQAQTHVQQYPPPPAAQSQAPQVQIGHYIAQPQLSQQLTQSSFAPMPPPQQYYTPPPSQLEQVQRQNNLTAALPQVGRPVTPSPPQQQYQSPLPPSQTIPVHQPQAIPSQVQQQAAPAQVHHQYVTSPQQYCPPGQIQRQDSGYYSQAPTPFQRPISIASSISSISSPVSRHNSIASYTPGAPPQPQQPYNPQQPQQHYYNPAQQPEQGTYNPALHARSQSVASPPPYFPPPPSGPQPLIAGKGPDYFNQGAQQHPSFPNYAQIGIGGQRGSVVGNSVPGQVPAQVPGQGWQWGHGIPQQQIPQQVGGGMVKVVGEPNYGPPPAVPGVWRSS